MPRFVMDDSVPHSIRKFLLPVYLIGCTNLGLEEKMGQIFKELARDRIADERKRNNRQ